jgi:hypothetical protein
VIQAKHELSRVELYEKVWSIPMRKLAKEFGMSDVGLAKLCRRHAIPLPGRGYWARIQHGQMSPKDSLPALADTKLDAITICQSEPKRRGYLDRPDGEETPTIRVNDDRPVTHPVVARIKDSISRNRTDDRGFLASLQSRVVPVKVCAGTLSRSLRLVDALFSAFAESHYALEWPKPYDKPLTIVVEDEKIRMIITEDIKRSDHKPTQEELFRQKKELYWRPIQWDYAATGELKITVESCEFSFIQRSWNDGKRRKLEQCLGEVLVACRLIASSVKKVRVERAEAEVLRREEEKRRAEQAVKQAEYDRKAKAVGELATAWRESRLLRDFANSLGLAATAAELPEEKKQEISTIVEWSLRHADYVDPLTDLDWTIAQFKPRQWLF